ncbi:MAG: hypothetical protein K0B10_07200 [Vicingaceae bacterium]|nr:hypothetical protein [Vicingaceae bacterium]
MATLIINIEGEDKNLLMSFLKKLKAKVKVVKEEKSLKISNEIPNKGLQESINDFKAGRVIKAKNATELIKKLSA